MEKLKNAFRSPSFWNWALVALVIMIFVGREFAQPESLFLSALLQNATMMVVGFSFLMTSRTYPLEQKNLFRVLSIMMICISTILFGMDVDSKGRSIEWNGHSRVRCHESFRDEALRAFDSKTEPLPTAEVRVALLKLDEELKSCLSKIK